MKSCNSTTGFTRPGPFGAFLFGLFVLPLLPAFTAAQTEAPNPTVAPVAPIQVQIVPAGPQNDADKAQAELAAAHAELAKLQKEIQLKQAHIKDMEARLAKIKFKEGEQPKEGAKMALEVVGGAKNANEVIIILRKVGDHWEVLQQPSMKPAPNPATNKSIRIEEKDGIIRIVPEEPSKAPEAPSYYRVVPAPDQPGKAPEAPGYYRVAPAPAPQGQPPMATPPALPRGKSEPENRLDKLENQLQQIIKELESLRKEMKQPGRTSATPAPDAPRIRVRVDEGETTPGKAIEVQETPRPVPPAPVPVPESR